MPYMTQVPMGKNNPRRQFFPPTGAVREVRLQRPFAALQFYNTNLTEITK